MNSPAEKQKLDERVSDLDLLGVPSSGIRGFFDYKDRVLSANLAGCYNETELEKLKEAYGGLKDSVDKFSRETIESRMTNIGKLQAINLAKKADYQLQNAIKNLEHYFSSEDETSAETFLNNADTFAYNARGFYLKAQSVLYENKDGVDSEGGGATLVYGEVKLSYEELDSLIQYVAGINQIIDGPKEKQKERFSEWKEKAQSDTKNKRIQHVLASLSQLKFV